MAWLSELMRKSERESTVRAASVGEMANRAVRAISDDDEPDHSRPVPWDWPEPAHRTHS